jgi:hypothetical protein
MMFLLLRAQCADDPTYIALGLPQVLAAVETNLAAILAGFLSRERQPQVLAAVETNLAAILAGFLSRERQAQSPGE